MKCSKCGAELENDMLFCRECGERVKSTSMEKCYCRECGAKISSGAKFCSACGAKVIDIETTSISSPSYEMHVDKEQPQTSKNVSKDSSFVKNNPENRSIYSAKKIITFLQKGKTIQNHLCDFLYFYHPLHNRAKGS